MTGTAPTRWWPPAPALKAATAVTVPTLAVVVAAGLLLGPTVSVGMFLGILATLTAALTSVGHGTRLAVGLLAVAGAAYGVHFGDHPWALAAGMVVLGLAQAPLSRQSAGVGAMLPVALAMAGGIGLTDGPVGVGAAVLGGALLITGVIAMLGARGPADPVPARTAWLHAAVVAVATAIGIGIAVDQGIGHGYWLVLTVSSVLRPFADETRRSARARSWGTVVGLVAAAGLVVVLPAAVAVLLAVVSAALSLAWALSRDEFRQVVYGTPLVVLVASSGVVGHQLGISLERLVMVGCGVVVALAAAEVLARVDRSA